ncbi:VWA domain-containing protein [Chitiniphilus purpureus]|uniref:VWA domain-containing protein n=1 Tax=Chitiniphilus purpureus TaxID=2981137 RepID=A0ABY6DT68_9NEIS|nr:VWA domain-containing protein [Chitiniphilus sp. CD1]UXY16928.1 VWA domain-containing protein [Chitiniphilus sp. CD1]
MPEAEDVLVGAARRLVAWGQAYRRARQPAPADALAAQIRRLDLLLAAVFGRRFVLRPAPPRLPHSVLSRLWRLQAPAGTRPLPATDGVQIWLPAHPAVPQHTGMAHLRLLALLQGIRAVRHSGMTPAAVSRIAADPLLADAYLLVEARASEAALQALLPGAGPELDVWRRAALHARPGLAAFAPALRPIEAEVRRALAAPVGNPDVPLPVTDAGEQRLAAAQALAATWRALLGGERRYGEVLFKDDWTGLLLPPTTMVDRPATAATERLPTDEAAPVRSARLQRTPQVRQAAEDEDDAQPAAWMVQTADPHEHAEDPFGLQRPIDQDTQDAAEGFAELVSELPQARLVSTPGRPREFLLADIPPTSGANTDLPALSERYDYPEWDCHRGQYAEHGTCVHLLPAALGNPAWVEATLAAHAPLLHAVRRQFEMLRAERLPLRRQLDGDELDLEAYLELRNDVRAGLAGHQRIYQSRAPQRRQMAVMLLVDASGSTDAWIGGERRVIDIEREALLLVSQALTRFGDPYAILAFSGEGAGGVTVREVKGYADSDPLAVALRIAALEPERYTRAGAAIRHGSAVLLRQPAAHRLLLLLSDGKPNDADRYAGRYGVEDTRRAVQEARQAGLTPFCLTVDRQGASYLPHLFGHGHYALLPRTERLGEALLHCLRRLLQQR